jgi:hypothetical protein
MFVFLFHVKYVKSFELTFHTIKDVLFEAASLAQCGQSLLLDGDDVLVEVARLIDESYGGTLLTNEVGERIETLLMEVVVHPDCFISKSTSDNILKSEIHIQTVLFLVPVSISTLKLNC